MANKPTKIQQNVPSWMLPKGLREEYGRKSDFRAALDRSRGAASHRGSSPSRESASGGRGVGSRRSGGHAGRISTEHAQRLAKYAPIIQHCSRKYGVPVSLICGVILQESGGNPRAVSHCGATGLMQLMPGTARRFGVSNSMDPMQNIEGGTKYLAFLKDRFNGEVPLMLAAYNAGEGNVQKYGNRIPPFAETQNYVPSVLSYATSIRDILRGGTRLDQPNAITTATHLPKFIKRA